MPFSEIILTAIADAVFGYLLDKYGETLGNWIRTKRGRDPIQKAFKKALGNALVQLEQQRQEWVSELFDASFFQHEGAPILAQFLIRDGHPDPSELAAQWANSLNIYHPERRTYYIRELEPVAASFLSTLAHQLKMQEALSGLNDSRTFEQLAQNVQALLEKFEADKATPGTRRDYLGWLITRNMYIDPRGTFQTQGQVQVKLDEVYVSLRAQQIDRLSSASLEHLFLDIKDWVSVTEYLKLLTERLGRIETGYIEKFSVHPIMLKYLKSWPENQDVKSFRFSQNAIDLLYPHGDMTFTDALSSKWLAAEFKSNLYLPLTFITSPEVLDLAEVARHYERLVILGDPGSGKTTLLRYLALKHAQALYEGRADANHGLGEARFPILVRIAEYAENSTWKNQAFSDFLVENHVLHECPRHGLADLLQTELEKGRCLVLLDGLDEIVDGDDRRGVGKRIEDFVQRYAANANRFAITSRIAGYKIAPLGESFARYTVQDMDENQIHLFLDRWCQAVEDNQTPEVPLQLRQIVARREVDGIMHAVQNIPGVRRLAVNPLLLRTLALIHRTGAQLPQKRIKLYELAAETLAHTWRTAQGVPESALIEDRYLTRLLGKLAYWMHANKPAGIATEQEVYREIGQEWARIKGLTWEEDHPDIEREVEKFLLAVQEHTGIFVERAPKQYSFMHLTFEEYYAARNLVARASTRARFLNQHRHDPRWEEPILLALGFVGLYYPEDAEELLETAILARGDTVESGEFAPSPYEDLLGRDYMFALRCVVDDIPVHSQLLRDLMFRCINELLHYIGLARFERYRQVLRERLNTLIKSKGGPLIVELIVKGVQDTDLNVRLRAIECMGVSGQKTTEFVSFLINALRNEHEITVRCAAMRSLVQLDVESTEVIAELRNLISDSNPRICCEAARSLWLLHQWHLGKDIISTLIQAEQNYLRDDGSKKDPEIIMLLSIIWDTLNLTSDKAVAVLVDLLHDTDANVRRQAAVLLRKLGTTDVHQNVIMALQQALTDENALVRLNAAESLAYLEHSSDEVVNVLFDAFNKDPVRQLEVVEAFSYLENPPSEVVMALLAIVRDRYVLRIKDEFADHVVGQACLLLSNLDYSADERPSLTEIITSFTEVLDDDDAYFCTVAAESLGRLGQWYPEARNILLQVLHGNNPALRSCAAHGLAQIRAENATAEIVQALQLALSDTESSVRYQAALSLGQLRRSSSEMINTLLEALRHTTGWQYALIPQYLGEFGEADEETIEALVQKLTEDQFIGGAGAYVQPLVQLGRRFPSSAHAISEKLVQILKDPKYAGNLSLANYVYEGLWQLIVSFEGIKSK